MYSTSTVALPTSFLGLEIQKNNKRITLLAFLFHLLTLRVLSQSVVTVAVVASVTLLIPDVLTSIVLTNSSVRVTALLVYSHGYTSYPTVLKHIHTQ